MPDTLINTVEKMPHVTGLTAVSNNAGVPGSGLGKLLASKQIKKMIDNVDHFSSQYAEERRYRAGVPGSIPSEYIQQNTPSEGSGPNVPMKSTGESGQRLVDETIDRIRYVSDTFGARSMTPTPTRRTSSRSNVGTREAIGYDAGVESSYGSQDYSAVAPLLNEEQRGIRVCWPQIRDVWIGSLFVALWVFVMWVWSSVSSGLLP